MLFSSKAGLLPTPNSTKIYSKNPNDFIKTSNYPIPFQAANIVESFNINCQPTWDISVSPKLVKFKAEWDLASQVYSNSTNADAFPKAVVSSLATYNLVQPAWNTSFNGKKLCIKIDWKISESFGHNNTTFDGQSSQINSSNFPVNSSLNFSTPFNSHSSSYQADSGYKSSNKPDKHYYSPVYYSPTVNSRPNYDVNTDNISRFPTTPRANLFNSHRNSLDRQDLYVPQSRNSVNCSSNSCKISKSENTDKYSPTVKQQQSQSTIEAEVASIKSHATDIAPEMDNNNAPVADNVVIHELSTLSEKSSPSSPNNIPITNNPSVTQHVPNPPESYSPSVDPPVSKTTQSVPVEEVKFPDKPPSQLVHDGPPPSEFTHIEPPKSHFPPSDPSAGGAIKPKSRKKKKSQHNNNPPIAVPPATQPPSQTHPTNLTCKSSATNAAENPDNRSAQILPSSRKFVIADRSKDGDIITDLTPQTPKFDAQNEFFLDTPKNFHVKSDGLLDLNLLADRMNITGKCRLCKAVVKSFNADLHLLECRRIDKNDIDNFAFEYADITNNNYDEIINIIYDYCNYVMHDDDVSYLFPKVSTFSKFLDDLEHLLDQKASKVYKKSEITGQQMRFNILNYSI
ncbi:Hypothetical predicted protein [Paramuricea clavata]|uniref:Uncharacterized protein n=1 Tax=Paramuricea clavata TaxID=317549 RepID=A0A6S7GFB1_PARCT|nr:Hypothetical predicted protein [Paramuricea clavata]